MFLANENFPKPGIILLREHRYTVISIQEDHQGIADEEVLEIAQQKGLTILTFDRDYGEIIFKSKLQEPPSVIYFREKGGTPEWAAITLIALLEGSSISFENAFTVVGKESLRQRFYRK